MGQKFIKYEVMNMETKVYQFPHKKKRHSKFGVWIIITCIFLLIFYLVDTDIFIVKNIEVTGNYYLSEKDIISLAGISPGQNIFTINLDKIRTNLLENPHIKDIKIRRSLPNSIIIDIDERNVVAAVPYSGVYLQIDEDGVVIEVSKEYQDSSMPILSGLKVKNFYVGKKLDLENISEFNKSLAILKGLKENKMEDLISEVRILDGSISLISSTGLMIDFNVEKNIDYRLSFLKSVLLDLSSKNYKEGHIIVDDVGNIIYRPNQ